MSFPYCDSPIWFLPPILSQVTWLNPRPGPIFLWSSHMTSHWRCLPDAARGETSTRRSLQHLSKPLLPNARLPKPSAIPFYLWLAFLKGCNKVTYQLSYNPKIILLIASTYPPFIPQHFLKGSPTNASLSWSCFSPLACDLLAALNFHPQP